MIDPEEDPGWQLSPAALLFVIPGYLRLAMRRKSGGHDGLATMRQIWTSFVSALVLFGVVILFTVPGSETSPARPWIVTGAVVTLGSLAAEQLALNRPLQFGDLQALAASYRTRFFLAAALSEAIALVAFVTTFIAGHWWIYWLFLPVSLIAHIRNAPTPTHVQRDQERLHVQGCRLSLVRALRAVPPTWS